MIATKEQEYKALEQIKKIVEGLGEGSYIATAFEGCFEIAEDNIRNDFGNSLKAICDSYAETQRQMEKDLIGYREECETLREKAEFYRKEMLAAASILLNITDASDILNELRTLKEENERLMKQSADYIIDHITDRGSDSFNNAADVLYKQQSRNEHLRHLINTLQIKNDAQISRKALIEEAQNA